MLKSHEKMDIEDVIQGYVQLLNKNQQTQKKTYNKWIEERNKNDTKDFKEVTCNKANKAVLSNDITKYNDNTDDVSGSECDDSSIECININSDAYNHYAEEPINDFHNAARGTCL